jgi:hypothetical protein
MMQPLLSDSFDVPDLYLIGGWSCSMAILPGYEYDVFLSYSHADNAAPEGGEGWVTHFAKNFEAALRQRLGKVSEALSIFFDSRVTSANYPLPELLVAAGKSALFLAIGSPSYATGDWTIQELNTFVQHVPDPSRLFMTECLPLNKGESYPPPLDLYFRAPFWRPSGSHGIPMPCSPVTEAEEFRLRIHDLAQKVRERLTNLRVLPAPTSRAERRSERALEAGTGPTSLASPATADGKVILLAQATDDVADEVDQLRLFLRQYEEEIQVLPNACYPQGGEMFRIALAKDLATADLFVQLLGKRAGRVPPDLPEGYTRHQLEAAKTAGVEIMQWRHPELDLSSVSDPAYASVLAAETVVACGLEAFKRQILAWVRKPKPRPQAVSSSSTIFINADSKDLSVAHEISRECVRHALTTFLPIVGPSSAESRKDLEDNLTDCDVLLFIYGDTTPDWIRSQLRFFSKVKPRRETEPKLLAICSGPPAEKPEIGVSFPNAHLINCPNAWSVEPIWKLIAETVES